MSNLIREFFGVEDSDQLAFTPVQDGKVMLSVLRLLAKSFFGMLRSHKRRRPVSQEEMENAIFEKRVRRGIRRKAEGP
jgi:hypothetical protein